MSELGKPFIKKSHRKNVKKSENAACEQKSKSDKLKFGSNTKLGLEWTMNGLVKQFRKKSNPKDRKKKTVKTKRKLPCEQKTPSEKDKISRRKTTGFFTPFPVSA